MDLRKLNLEVVFVGGAEDVIEFVKEFGLEKEFKKVTGVSIDNWEFEDSDDEIIGELMERYMDNENEIYFLIYNEAREYFEIYKITSKA